MCFGRMLKICDAKYNGEDWKIKGWNWLWAAEKSYGGEESDQRLRAGNKPGGVVGPFGLPGESLQVLTGSACGTAETPDSG